MCLTKSTNRQVHGINSNNIISREYITTREMGFFMNGKKIVIMVGLSFLIASCSLINPRPQTTPTPVPSTPTISPTPEPCSQENIIEEMEYVQDLVNEFQDIAYVANFTPQTELVNPIMQLQNTRRKLQKLEVPDCLENVKNASLNYMNTTINYLAYFMGGETKENVDAGIQNSQVLWKVVLNEFSNALSTAGLAPEEIPGVSSGPPETSDTSIWATNEGDAAINVRQEPNLDADIVSKFEPGMQAAVILRNDDGDWIQINLEGTIGWVFVENATISVPIEDVPLQEEETEIIEE